MTDRIRFNRYEHLLEDRIAPSVALVRDIYEGANFSLDSAPSSFTAVGSTLFFVANRQNNTGAELWKTDGTTAGTMLVRDIAGGSFTPTITDPVAFKGKLVFAANDRINGQELWISDGTSSGTKLLTDIVPGVDSSNPVKLTVAGDALFFHATTAANGTELWVTDGTPFGTRLVRDINPGVSGSLLGANSTAGSMAAVGNRLYFSATVTNSGTELWVSDGTSSGTRLVEDLVPGTK